MKKNFTYNDELYHYGVKGMKWHKRKAGKKPIGKGGNEEHVMGDVRYVDNSDRREFEYEWGPDRVSTNRNRHDYESVYSDGNGRRYRSTANISRQAVNIDGTTNTNRYRVENDVYRTRSHKKPKRR